jgi:hypothetical protein
MARNCSTRYVALKTRACLIIRHRIAAQINNEEMPEWIGVNAKLG